MVICFLVDDVINFENSHSFPIGPTKSGQKFKYLKNEKIFYHRIKITFFIVFKRLSLKQIKPTFMEGQTQTIQMFNNNNDPFKPCLHLNISQSFNILIV